MPHPTAQQSRSSTPDATSQGTVVHFILDPRVGGPHNYIKALHQGAAHFPRPCIVTAGHGPVTDVALFNLRHTWRPLYLLEVPLNILAILLFRLFGRLGREHTVFHIHGAANIAPLAAARILGLPTLWHFHETSGAPAAIVGLGKALLSPKKGRLASVADAAVRHFDLNDCTLLPPPVDTDFWHRTEPFEPTPVPEIVAVGNLNPLKGQDLLLHAMDDVPGPWHLHLMGSPLASHQAFSEKIHRLRGDLETRHPDCRVTLHGWASPETIRERMARARLFVLPSRSEGCPIALLEAMSMEQLCVATDVGDVTSILSRKNTGLIVPPEQPGALSAAITSALDMSEAARRKMGAAARDHVISKHSMATIASKHSTMYASISN
ncbi:MAG: glycosyltransferase family 4 protein [Leptospirillia bacterium]